MTQTTDTALAEPLPSIGPPPSGPSFWSDPVGWVRRNLFQNWRNTIVTVIMAALLARLGYAVGRFLFTAEWRVIRVNLTNYMVGTFPRDELWRPWLAIFLVAFAGSVLAGIGATGRPGGSLRANARRIVPPLTLVVVLLAFATTPLPAVLTVVAAGLAAVGWIVGRRLPPRARRYRPLGLLAVLLLAYAAFTAFGGVGWEAWGGLLLTLFLAVGAITLSFPFGVLLALGRRSSLPAVRLVSVVYIELIRGVPLITILFLGQFMLGLFLPAGLRPEDVTRALIALTAFTAAYVAEIVRGGLQGVPSGQTEAAQAIGLSPIKTTFLVVLPQGLRNVIPALVGQFISLFKDTSLVAIIGILDLLAVAQAVTNQPDFLGQGLQTVSLGFAAFIYWVFCYSMSRESQRLERRLGVGER